MFNQFTKAIYSYAQKTAGQSALWANFARETAKNYVVTAHHTLLILGILAISLLSLIIVKPEIADHIRKIFPFSEKYAAVDANSDTPDVINIAAADSATQINAAQQKIDQVSKPQHVSSATSTEQKWVTYWLSKRYRVAGDAIHKLVLTSYQVAHDLKLDPLLILSVIAIESRFNPLSESPVGAQGLMQVMSKIHYARFQKHGGISAALNPVANIKVGSRILKEYVVQGGSVEAGLKKYVGAANFDTDFGYGHKVLSEYSYLQEVATGKKISFYVTTRSRPRAQSKIVKSNEPAELPSTATDDSPKSVNKPTDGSDQIAIL
ncbi:MAG: transglycosylase SLT domain-containing protein [Burkholderiaceae bacterium]